MIKYRGKWLHWKKRGGAFRMIQQKEGMKEQVIKANTQEKFEDTKGITKTRNLISNGRNYIP